MNRSITLAVGIAVIGIGVALWLLQKPEPANKERSTEGAYEMTGSLPGAIDAPSAEYWQMAFRNNDWPGITGLSDRGAVVQIAPARIHASEAIGGMVLVYVESGPQIGRKFYMAEGVFRCFVMYEGCDAFPFMHAEPKPNKPKSSFPK